MANSEKITYVLLLVEDNIADAELVQELLEQADPDGYAITKAERMAAALEKLKSNQFDVVLLDLGLPDATGLETVRAVRAVTNNVPIVVLTGNDNEELGLRCIDAGAQDFLSKNALNTLLLRRAIGYALVRQREAQLREMQQALAQFRSLSSATSSTATTATLAGIGSVRARYPALFESATELYIIIVQTYFDYLVTKKEKPRGEMERIITQLGDTGAGPRDLLDVHVAALDYIVTNMEGRYPRALVVEGRLLALEMMGLLVDYYRTGQRRRFL